MNPILFFFSKMLYLPHMGLLPILNAIIITIGIPTIIGALIFIGKKLHLLESLEGDTQKIKHNMKVVSDYLTRHHIEFNPAELRATSPLQLTDAGKDFVKLSVLRMCSQLIRMISLVVLKAKKPLPLPFWRLDLMVLFCVKRK